MGEPRRIQLSRKKGWRMPENTVKVDRTTPWGNRYRVWQQGRWINDGSPAWVGAHDWELNYPAFRTRDEAAERAVNGFRADVASGRFAASLAPLRGKNLACWCKPGTPCHADVLLELANKPVAPTGGEQGR